MESSTRPDGGQSEILRQLSTQLAVRPEAKEPLLPHPDETLYRVILRIVVGLLLARSSANWNLIRESLRLDEAIIKVAGDLFKAGVIDDPRRIRQDLITKDLYRLIVGGDELIRVWQSLDAADANARGAA